MSAERASLNEVLLADRFQIALRKLNPSLPALEEAFRKVSIPQYPSLIANNRALHRMLVDGISVECRRKDGSIGAEIVRLLDFDEPEANDWLAVNQLPVIEGQHNRRPDIVIFVNGLPLGLIELKNAADEDADIWAAFYQFQTYQEQIPSLFAYNAVLVVSDGLEARIGAIRADRERFMPWRTIEGETLAPASMAQLEGLLRGVFDRRRFLDLNTAVSETIRAAGFESSFDGQTKDTTGDKRVGVVWHTQGSGGCRRRGVYNNSKILP